MMRRFLRAFWPIAVLALVFALRSLGCKAKPPADTTHFVRQPSPRWTIPKPLATPTAPPWVTVIPNPPG